MGTRSFLGVTLPGLGVDHPPTSRVEVEDRVNLYLYFLFWAFMACYRVNFTKNIYNVIYFRNRDIP
jgi:hypothetical protein